MVLTKKAYDALPYAYIGLAFLSVALLDSPIKYLSFLLLLFASMLVLLWRKAERQRSDRALLNHPRRLKVHMRNSHSVSERTLL